METKKLIQLFLDRFNIDFIDENFKDTPQRIVRVYEELLEGSRPEAMNKVEEILSKTFPSKYSGMVTKTNISAYTLCPHHFLPVQMDISLAYIPKEKVLGISKLLRLIEILSHKPALQEDLTDELADTLFNKIDSRGSMVVIKGEHFCEKMRGVHRDSTTITSSVRGMFEEQINPREEFLKLVK